MNTPTGQHDWLRPIAITRQLVRYRPTLLGDGTAILAGGCDSTLQLWDLADGTHLESIPMSAPIISLATGHQKLVVSTWHGILAFAL